MSRLARHTPTLTGARITRAVSIDAALVSHIGDAIAQLAQAHEWELVGDSIDAVIDEVFQALDYYYGSHMIGSIQAFIGAIPTGYIACIGQTLDQADYPELAAVLDAQYLDDQAGTITLPDLRDRFFVGQGTTYSLGETGGANTHTLTEGELPSHTHTYLPPVQDVDLEAPGAPDIAAARLGGPTQTGSTGNNQAHENRPPYLAITWAIFAGR